MVHPWVAGRLVKVGNAHRLDGLSAQEGTHIDTALRTLGQQ